MGMIKSSVDMIFLRIVMVSVMEISYAVLVDILLVKMTMKIDGQLKQEDIIHITQKLINKSALLLAKSWKITSQMSKW